MSTSFSVIDWDDINSSLDVYNMGNGRADAYRELTEVVATHYGLTSGILDRKYNPFQDYSVEPEPFCALVEAVFADPVDLLSGWAQYAAAMYEAIKRHRYQWAWDGWPPRPPFLPHYYGDNPQAWGAAWQEKTWRLPPGEVRFETEEGKVVAYMPQRRAILFVSIEGFAQGDTPSGLSELEGAQCRVEAEPFCRYVEKLVSDPYQNSFYHSWAEHAAGMYEVIQGQWYCWAWPPLFPHSPFLGFTPVRQLRFAPTQMSGITLGSPWWAMARPEQPAPENSEGG